MWLRILDFIGLTNLSDEEVCEYYKRAIKLGSADEGRSKMDDEAAVKAVAASKIIEFFANRVEISSKEKKTYSEKLENAVGEDIFKYILLINISALEGYVAQTRIQAQQSFKLSKIISITGFIILSVTIILSIYLTIIGNDNFNAAYLGGIAGVLTEFTGGIFFYLYNKTLQQINLFHDKLVSMQQISMSYMATSRIQNEEKKDQAKIDVSKQLMHTSKTNSV